MEKIEFKAQYKPQQLKRIGLHILSMIRDRTAKGIDKDGKPFKPYSTNPFKMPYAVATKSAVKKLIQDGKAILFNRGGTKFVLIKSGYLDYKKLVYNGTSYDGTVNLMLTGRMLQDLNVLRFDNNQIIIGFNNMEMAQRAMFNINRGRDFLGLSDADLQNPKLKELLAEGIELV